MATLPRAAKLTIQRMLVNREPPALYGLTWTLSRSGYRSAGFGNKGGCRHRSVVVRYVNDSHFQLLSLANGETHPSGFTVSTEVEISPRSVSAASPMT